MVTVDLDDSTLLEAARAVRAYLAGLLDEQTAKAVDDSLAAALCTSGDDASAARAVRAVLDAHPETALWTAEFAEHAVPADVVRTSRGTGPPGRGGVVLAPRFACPEGDYVWYRRSKAVLIPLCPTHAVRLLPRPLAQR